MSILNLCKISVRSEQGQEYLRKQHRAMLSALDRFPNLRSRVFNGEWSQDFLRALCGRNGSLAGLSYPDLYLAPKSIKCKILPRNYLKRAEAGLEFIIRKASNNHLKDLIARLRRGGPAAATFELMVAWALSSYFGEEAIEPYPKISHGSKKTVDFALHINGKRLLLEATMLFDPKDEVVARSYAIEHEHQDTFCWGGDEEDQWRLLKACQKKATQRELQCSLVLCINQIPPWPLPRVGIGVMGKLLDWSARETKSKLIAAAYFTSGHFVGLVRNPLDAAAKGVSYPVFDKLERAFVKIRHSNSAIPQGG